MLSDMRSLGMTNYPLMTLQFERQKVSHPLLSLHVHVHVATDIVIIMYIKWLTYLWK